MKAQDLKNSILQLAIQGKLVPQDESDEPAEVLYAKIQAEKQKLIKEGKIKKDKPLPPITDDEIPFQIPSTWKWVRLGNLCFLDNGVIVQGENLPLLDARYLRGKKIPDMLETGIKIYKGEYLILVDGENSGEVFCAFENGYMGSTFKRLYFYNQCCLAYLLKVLKFYQKMFRENKKGGAIPHLDKNLFKNLMIGLPPLAEQKRIVAKIEELEPLIKQYEQAETDLSTLNDTFPEQLKKSILQYAIQGKLVPQDQNDEPAEVLYTKIQAEKQKLIKEGKIKKDKPLPPITDDEIPFPIPSTWKWVRWGELSESIQYGYNAPAQKKGRVKMLRISDIQQNRVQWDTVPYCDIKEKEIETYLLRINDILFARTGGTVGKSFLVNEVNEDVIYAGYLIRTRYSYLLCPQYLKYFMESEIYWSQLRNGTIATAQPNCNGQTLSKMLIPLPPLAEQHRIVTKVNELMQYCEELTYPENRKSIEPITPEWLIDKGFASCQQNGYTDVNAILDELGILVMQDRNLKKGRIEYDDNKKKFQIWVNDLNDNWTKTHELVHYVNDNGDIKLYGAVGRKDETSLSKTKERNVDALTAEILMPEDIFTSVLEQENIKKGTLIDNVFVRKLGKQFRVSDYAIKIRLQNLGYFTK